MSSKNTFLIYDNTVLSAIISLRLLIRVTLLDSWQNVPYNDEKR